MDTVEFLTSFSRIEDYKVVDIYINGINLIDMLWQIEMPLAYQEGAPEMAGAYEGLPPLFVYPPAGHFLGKANTAYAYDDGKVSLLEYAYSGVPGEWPFVARIQVEENEISWSAFEQVRRNKLRNGYRWHYDMMGTFNFDREQYQDALEQAAKQAY
jgi:hypothetical protein